MAEAASVTPDELHHLFRRWAGLTPKAFMQALTLDHAKGLLRDSASVLDAALDSGLSGPGRLHDLFVTHEAMSPGEWKNGGAGMTLRYGFHPSPLGTAIVIASGRGLAGLAFADPGEEPAALTCSGAGHARPMSRTASAPPTWRSACSTRRCGADQPLRVVLIGTDFEVRVWETLFVDPDGPRGLLFRHRQQHQQPEGVARLGAAVGKNPISFVVPCHRALGKSGALTGYHWGITRKQAMLGWEAGQVRGALEGAEGGQSRPCGVPTIYPVMGFERLGAARRARLCPPYEFCGLSVIDDRKPIAHNHPSDKRWIHAKTSSCHVLAILDGWGWREDRQTMPFARPTHRISIACGPPGRTPSCIRRDRCRPSRRSDG